MIQKRAKNFIYNISRAHSKEVIYKLNDKEFSQLLDYLLSPIGKFQRYCLFFVSKKQKEIATLNFHSLQKELEYEEKIKLTDECEIVKKSNA